MKEVKFTFTDGGYYIVRESGGDTICGRIGHDIMFAMSREFQWKERPMQDKLDFIHKWLKK